MSRPDWGVYRNAKRTREVLCEIGEQGDDKSLKLVHRFSAANFNEALAYWEGYQDCRREEGYEDD